MSEGSMVFVNGPVFTSDPTRPWVRAVAVVDGRIAAAGTEAECLGLLDDTMPVIDLAGRMLGAGFVDAHVHPIHGGLGLIRCELSELPGRADALEAIRDYARDHAGSWVTGRGWAFEWFDGGCPDAALLDELVGDRPAYFVVRDGHSAWASSKALEMAGIDETTPDPPDGRIQRRPDGSPQGTLHEGAMDVVERVLPPDGDDDLDRALDAGQEYLLSRGITAWHDAWISDEYHRTYLRAEAAGRLRGTVRGAIWWDRDRQIDQLARVEAMAGERTGRYSPGAVKLMLDGVCENFTASMLDPYLGQAGDGLDFIDPEQLAVIVTTLDSRGLQCHFHAIGDAAVRSALDAVEAARLANGWTDLRHTIAHIQVVDPSDVARFHRLGVVANCQPLWACHDPAMTEMTIPFLGPERAATQYPFGSLSRTGAVLAMGSDWPVTTADVMAQCSVAVRRRPPADDAPEVFLLAERLDLGQALIAFTAGSAFVNHQERARGSIRAGNVADLVVLDGDPFTVGDPASVGVDLTVVAGTIVYERGVH